MINLTPRDRKGHFVPKETVKMRLISNRNAAQKRLEVLTAGTSKRQGKYTVETLTAHIEDLTAALKQNFPYEVGVTYKASKSKKDLRNCLYVRRTYFRKILAGLEAGLPVKTRLNETQVRNELTNIENLIQKNFPSKRQPKVEAVAVQS